MCDTCIQKKIKITYGIEKSVKMPETFVMFDILTLSHIFMSSVIFIFWCNACLALKVGYCMLMKTTTMMFW